jgi:Chaperone of endosialidase
MKGKKVILGTVMFLVIFTGSAWAGAVPVSPGGGTELTPQSCPTFSWSASDGAQSYRVEVYEQVTSDILHRDTMRGMGNPVVKKEIPAPALSWTPSTGECLSRGMKYVWYVEGVDAKGEGQWSGGEGFQVEAAALSADQNAAVQDVVKGYLSGEGSGSGVTTNTSRQAITPSTITPSYVEGTTNSFFGNQAGFNTTGYDDTFIGGGAGYSNTSGYANTFLGFGTGFSTKSGYNNVFLGDYTGYSSTTGTGNVFIGYEAGFSETGSNKLYIDNCYTGYPCTEPFIKGDFAARTLQIDGSLTIVSLATPSDIRFKKDVHTLKSALDKVLKLRGVTYEWDKDKVHGAGFPGGRQIGLIAQEVEKELPELVHTDSNGYKSLSYDKLGPVLIEAVKEQQKEITDEKDEITEQEKEIEEEAAMISTEKAVIAKLEKVLGTTDKRVAALENPIRTAALK